LHPVRAAVPGRAQAQGTASHRRAQGDDVDVSFRDPGSWVEKREERTIGQRLREGDIFWNAINTELFDVCASRASSRWFVFII
jgi:hypothetical protein